MLTSNDWNKIEKQARKLYSNLELEIIKEIAERIANFGYANTVVLNDLQIAQEMGMLYTDIINLVAQDTNKSFDEIKDIFESAGYKSLAYDDKIYKMAGYIPKNLKQSYSMVQLLEATIRNTNYNLNNLVRTTAVTSQTEFYKAMNKAYMEVSTGTKSYSQSIIDTISDLSKNSTKIIYPSGRQMSIESAIRMNIVTSVNQMCGQLQLIRADEMNWDLMELTAHAGARPEHAEWQGKVVSRSGKKGYLSLEDIGYGTVTGFKGVNCRHDWRPYYANSSLTYSKEELKEINNQTVKYQGKDISKYEATQIQRSLERKIRQDKKEISGLQGILINSKDNELLKQANESLQSAKLKQKLHTNNLNQFLEETGSRKDYSRLKI